MDLQSNPPKMYKNFDTLVAEGERNFINAPDMTDVIENPENKINLSDKKENIDDK